MVATSVEKYDSDNEKLRATSDWCFSPCNVQCASREFPLERLREGALWCCASRSVRAGIWILDAFYQPLMVFFGIMRAEEHGTDA